MNEREISLFMAVIKRQASDLSKANASETNETLKKITVLRGVVTDTTKQLVERAYTQEKGLHRTLDSLEAKIIERQTKTANSLVTQTERLEELELKQVKMLDAYRRKIERLEKKCEELTAKTRSALRGDTGADARSATAVDPRASTLAIFDSIVFAMSNWSNEGDTAPDFELACQSVLFPTIYERVMKGEDDYYIEEVPVSALEVVKRGREYIKMLRDTAQASLVDPNVWESYAPMVQEWWVNDALPLLYGARSEEWDEDEAFSLFQVQEWKSQPASRALNFPLLFDGMELVEKQRDQIRETTGLPEFNKQTLQTRINP